MIRNFVNFDNPLKHPQFENRNKRSLINIGALKERRPHSLLRANSYRLPFVDGVYHEQKISLHKLFCV